MQCCKTKSEGRGVIRDYLESYRNHFLRIIDNLLPRFLNFGNGNVTREHMINIGDHRRKRRLVEDARGGMDDIGANNDGRVLPVSEERNGSCVWDGIDASKFNVDSTEKCQWMGGRDEIRVVNRGIRLTSSRHWRNTEVSHGSTCYFEGIG